MLFVRKHNTTAWCFITCRYCQFRSNGKCSQ